MLRIPRSNYSRSYTYARFHRHDKGRIAAIEKADPEGGSSGSAAVLHGSAETAGAVTRTMHATEKILPMALPLFEKMAIA
jgi:hypothetical protein